MREVFTHASTSSHHASLLAASPRSLTVAALPGARLSLGRQRLDQPRIALREPFMLVGTGPRGMGAAGRIASSALSL